MLIDLNVEGRMGQSSSFSFGFPFAFHAFFPQPLLFSFSPIELSHLFCFVCLLCTFLKKCIGLLHLEMRTLETTCTFPPWPFGLSNETWKPLSASLESFVFFFRFAFFFFTD